LYDQSPSIQIAVVPVWHSVLLIFKAAGEKKLGVKCLDGDHFAFWWSKSASRFGAPHWRVNPMGQHTAEIAPSDQRIQKRMTSRIAIFSGLSHAISLKLPSSRSDMQSRGGTLSLMERRRDQRFEFDLPIIVRWTEDSGQREAHSVTQDVNSSGMYFFLEKGIPEGTDVEIEMTLPTQVTLGPPTKVRCKGNIRRCDRVAHKPAGMATAITKYEFLAKSKDGA
jgi:hypothetical protein